jgi:arsenate reductase-like glutaredoxin family protein
MIEHITQDELQECDALSEKGWSNCSKEEKARWAELSAKATLALAKHDVLVAIEVHRVIKRYY